MQCVLIEGGELYDPEPLGRSMVLLIGDRVARCGVVEAEQLARAGFDVETVDARGCLVLPGLIDAHEHLIGGSGERGFASQTPEIQLEELARAGVTSVVGCLGVDTTTKQPEALVAKVKGLRDEGIGACCYMGGYDVPPVTLTGSVRRDMLLVEEVIGAGEIAISDLRGAQPSVAELARVVADAYVGGLLTGKAGVTHFHVGDEKRGLEPLRELIAHHDVDAGCLYPTHVERTPALLREAAEITHLGVTVDVDVVEGDLARSVSDFSRAGGLFDRLTASSDAAITAPASLFTQIVALVREGVCPLEKAVLLATRNPARVLKLKDRGRLGPGTRADVLIVDAARLELRDVWASGRRLLRDGRVAAAPRWQEQSTRRSLA
jgi:beta-aspartyl-dipeptidase (metallo-type)